jgi:stage V sporulation protein D (sporulation-specific penicillin-binding protein)
MQGGLWMKVSSATVRRRLFITLIIGSLVFVALVFRLGYVQLWKGNELSDRAENSWRRDIPFTAKRGDILDRNGIQLAYDISSPTVMAVPAQVKNAEKTAELLADKLDMTVEKVLGMLTKRSLIVKLQPGGRKISTEKAQEIHALHLPGIYVAEDNKRYYPYGTLAAHILGFTGIESQGLTGVELKYNDYLTGRSGNVSFLADASGRQMPGSSDTYVEPKDGLQLQLTIDKHVQSILERELDQAMLQYQPKNIIAIAMNPKNGEILGMASRPTYEPGNYKAYPAEVYNRNLPIWMTYEPGSTFKIITLAAAIEEQQVDLHKDRYFDKGFIEVSGSRLRCWKKGGHGDQTFLQVVENSCNPGFVVLGQRLGEEKLFDYINKFGFGQKTGIDLGGEENGIMFKPSQVGPVELATTAFGQGVSVTPIQQIAAVSAAVNGGKLYTPYVAKAWLHPETGEVVHETEPKLVRQVISEETSKQVRMALESVVAKGTGRNAYIDGYRVGGKTGTAQKAVNGRYLADEHIVSFIGFAPADDPEVVIYLAVDDPQGIQFGGVVAAPIVRNMMEDTLRYLDVEPRKEQLEKAYRREFGEVPYMEVPDLVGMTVSEIFQDLGSTFSLAKAGSGNTVISQAPKPGTRLERGATIRIFLAEQKQKDE